MLENQFVLKPNFLCFPSKLLGDKAVRWYQTGISEKNGDCHIDNSTVETII